MKEHNPSVVNGLTLLEALDSRRNPVWRARRVHDGTDVAVKLLGGAYEPLVPGRRGRANRILAALVDHDPGWIDPLGHGHTTDGRRYVITPFHRAGSLDDQIRQGPMPWYPASRLMARVATTMAAAHEAGWCFGHLRPSSILIDGHGNPVIGVYGSSTRRFDDGTAEFTAPELDRGSTPHPPSDVFSLGLILSSLIAGRPIDHDERAESILAELGETPPRIVEIIDYALSISLRNRFGDATKLASALNTALASEPGVGLGGEEPSRSGPTTDRPGPTDDALSAFLAGPLLEPHHDPDGTTVDPGTSSPPSTEEPAGTGFEAPTLEPGIGPDADETANPLSWPTEDGLDDVTDPFVMLPGLDTLTGTAGSGDGNGVAGDDGPTGPAPTVRSGPLSDLIEPAAALDDPDPTLDHGDMVRARLEIEQIVRRLRVGDEVTNSPPPAPGDPDVDAVSVGDPVAEPQPVDPDDESDESTSPANDHRTDPDEPFDGDGAGTGIDRNGARPEPDRPPPDRAPADPEAAPGLNRATVRPTSPEAQPANSAAARLSPGRDARTVGRLETIIDLIWMNRRRLASSFALLSVTLAVGLAIILAIGQLRIEDTVVTGLAPRSTGSTIGDGDPGASRPGSPLNNQDPIRNARSVSYDEIANQEPSQRTGSTSGVDPTTSTTSPATTSRPSALTSSTSDGARTGGTGPITETSTEVPPTTAGDVGDRTETTSAPQTTEPNRRRTTTTAGDPVVETTATPTTATASSSRATTAPPPTTAAPTTTAPTTSSARPRGRDQSTTTGP